MAYYVISHQAPARLIPMPDGTVGFESPYDAGLVAALKAQIPYSDRRWDRDQKLWFVAAQHASTLADLAEQYLGRRPTVPQVQTRTQTETRLLDVRYIGAAKERAGGQRTASGWVAGGWNAIFPESVLKSWFAVGDRPEEASTLYAVLGVSRAIDAAKLKRAYFQAARQWHPDVCKEPGAAEQFRRIRDAYEVLSDPLKRRKYDAGLQLAASVGQSEPAQVGNIWRPPLRCGYILCNGVEQLGRFVVSEILEWQDIVDSRGRTLVTSWQYGDDSFTERWI